MRSLWIGSIIALIVVGGIALYATKLIGDVKLREKKLTEAFDERSAGLLALDKSYAYTPRKTLDPERMDAYLTARGETAKFMRERFAEHTTENAFHAKETRNEVLLVLTSELTKAQMSLAEYRAISLRWQALLARGERLALMTQWKRVVKTNDHPDGLPMGAPAKDAAPDELALFRKHEETLSQGLDADLLGPTLTRVAGP